MKKQKTFVFIFIVCLSNTFAQQNRARLDFAKTYFELGGTFLPSFTGKEIINNKVSQFRNSSSVNSYLNWGAFHFWGHGEIYVSFPLAQLNFNTHEETDFELRHAVSTGFRVFPWAYQESKLQPYFGASWSAFDFKQKIKADEDNPMISKDITLAFDAGLLYGYKSFALRLGLHYFPDNQWKYPISKTRLEKVKTPKFGFQAGLLYTFESSGNVDPGSAKKWNSYPKLSKQNIDKEKFGDFFVGIGPSISFSLSKSAYNQSQLPYLKNKLVSSNFFDLAAGYQFYQAGLFTALSFRNPKFKTRGYGSSQEIKKTSLTFEVNKFLFDYTGFAPYIGLNLAYDRLKYHEKENDVGRALTIHSVEPGLTFGWDIQPGKIDEAIILRTNLRWYPFASFKIDGKQFNRHFAPSIQFDNIFQIASLRA